MLTRSQSISPMLPILVALTHAATLNILAADPTAFRPLVKPAVPHVRSAQPERGNHQHHQNRKGVKNTMELDLTQAELPSQGTYPAVFVDVIEGKTLVKKRTYPTLRLVIEMDKEKSDRSRFTIERRYTLNAKGQRKLRAEVQTWLGAGGLSTENTKRFVPETIFLHKPCQATVSYETEDGRTVARASACLPAGETKLTPSGKYVRKESAQPTTETSSQVTGSTPAGAPASA